MKTVETQKFVLLLRPQSANDGDFSNNTYVDTSGWAHARFLLQTGDLAAAVGSTAEGTAPLVEECDTTGGTYAAVTSAALADAISDSEDNQLHAIDVDLNKSHKRYMRVQAPHAGAGACNLAILCILSNKISGTFDGGATDAGLDEKVSA